MAGGVPHLMQCRAMPVDRLEIGLRRGDHDEVWARGVEGAVAADAEVDAGGTNEGLDLRLDQPWRRWRRDGCDVLGQVLALRRVEDGEAL